MLKPQVEDILVKQIEKEAYSSNLYLAMAVWAETNGFAGVADWMYAQADEERLHMLKFVKYVNERGGKGVIPAIEMPPVNFESVLDLFTKTMTHENFITESINEIVGVCMEQRDFNTLQWTQWFVNEQIEEERNVSSLLDKLKMIGDSGTLYFFDRDIMAIRAAASAANAAQ